MSTVLISCTLFTHLFTNFFLLLLYETRLHLTILTFFLYILSLFLPQNKKVIVFCFCLFFGHNSYCFLPIVSLYQTVQSFLVGIAELLISLLLVINLQSHFFFLRTMRYNCEITFLIFSFIFIPWWKQASIYALLTLEISKEIYFENTLYILF